MYWLEDCTSWQNVFVMRERERERERERLTNDWNGDVSTGKVPEDG